MPMLITDSSADEDRQTAEEHQRLRGVEADGAMLLFDDQEDQARHPPRRVAEQRREPRIDAGARRTGQVGDGSASATRYGPDLLEAHLAVVPRHR